MSQLEHQATVIMTESQKSRRKANSCTMYRFKLVYWYLNMLQVLDLFIKHFFCNLYWPFYLLDVLSVNLLSHLPP